MKIVAVFHADKNEEGLADEPREIAANPNLTLRGMEKTHQLVESIRPFGPFTACYSSRLARALDTASILCLAFGLDLQTLEGFGQHANKVGDEIVYYPGHEEENFLFWQKEAIAAFRHIIARHKAEETILVVSHRPSLAGVVAWIEGIEDEEAIKRIANNPAFAEKGFIVFEVDEEGKIW